MISYNDFVKMDLRTAKIIEVEKIKNSTKLYKIIADIGIKKIQIISGLAQHYLLEELKGKNIIVLVNLEIKIINGEESQGMLLAAVDEQKNISLIIPDKDFNPGIKIY